jgi:hypothetical protein
MSRMYGINRCPRCGGHRLLKPLAGGIFVLCVGCGLMTDEPELPLPPSATNLKRSRLALNLRRQGWEFEPLAGGCHLMQTNYP